VVLRKLRMTAAEIAEALGMALWTVSLWLKRVGLGKRRGSSRPSRRTATSAAALASSSTSTSRSSGASRLPAKRVIGGRHASRGFGWECVHVMIDDCSRLPYTEVLPDERGETAIGFLRRGLAWFARLGVRVEQVLTDNGAPYVSTAHALACRELGLRHLRTRPYRPRTNGKADARTAKPSASSSRSKTNGPTASAGRSPARRPVGARSWSLAL
jgi:transposase InsO family protein